MTLDKILERIKTLEQERDQLRNNLIAYEGAIQDCRHWLEQLEKDEQDNSK